MKKNIRPLIIVSMLLLVVPVLFMLTQWQWHPVESSSYLKALWLLTQTAGNPYSAISSVVLALWFCWCLKLSLEQNIKLLMLLILMVLMVVLFKAVLKELTQEPRPFVVWLGQLLHLSPLDFYHLDKAGRVAWIANHAASIPNVAEWQIKYWQTEVSYSFPSGHTLFSASWTLLGTLLLFRRGCYITCLLLIVWQMAISVSRLLLGMHWPSDILFSILFAIIITLITNWLINKVVLKHNQQRRLF